MTINGPIEPSGDLRAAAVSLFVAYVQAGFTEDQALRLIGHLISRPTEGD